MMLDKIKNIFNNQTNRINKLLKESETVKIFNGKIFGELNFIHKKDAILHNIQAAEFKVFSQWGDDGIIHFLVNYLDIESKIFVEFGVENYTECNTRFLLINQNWKGLIMDGSLTNMQQVRSDDIYWKYDLTAIDAFVTKENINSILQNNNLTGEIGLLHIDIDGNDYWIWQEIDVIDPVIVVVEYNSVFGDSNAWTVPYAADFVRTQKHYSNLYYGSSILSLCDLAKEKNYEFIGCNSNGNNAYFIRKDRIKNLQIKTPQQGYVESKFSESRNKDHSLSYVRGKYRLQLLKECELFNTRSGKTELIK